MNLITGATGLIGAHVALKLLMQGKPVTAIKRPGSDLSKTRHLFSYYTPEAEHLFQKITWVDADILDIFSLLEALDGIDTVFHCAGYVSFNEAYKKQLHQVNAQGTANVVNACLEKKIKALCHVSSIATLQNPDLIKDIDESVYWKSSPRASDYAISKYNGEREVWRGIEEGLQAVIVNPGLVLGPGFWSQSSGKLIETCYQGSAFYTNGSSGSVDAMDVADCMIRLVDKHLFGKRFILVEGNHSFKEILTLVHKALGKKQPWMEAGKLVLTVGKMADSLRHKLTGKEQLITKATVIAGLEKNTYNNAKIKEALSFQFIPLQESVTFACRAYLNDIKK